MPVPCALIALLRRRPPTRRALWCGLIAVPASSLRAKRPAHACKSAGARLLTLRAAGCAIGWGSQTTHSMTGLAWQSCRWRSAFLATTRRAATCHRRRSAPKPAMDHIGTPALTLLIGGYAQKWHLGGKSSVTDHVAGWKTYAPNVFPLPHPSWRNTGWITKNPWFETDLLPALKARVQRALAEKTRTA